MVCAQTAPAAEVRILALGDSYTIGEAVQPDARWPVQLAALLRTHGVAAAQPVIVARTGWTTDELSAGIDAAHLHGPYDLVTLLIGVNNQYRGRRADEYRSQFRALLARAVAFANSCADRVIVVSIPDWGVTPFAVGRDRAGISAAINRFNAIDQEEAIRAGVRFVDITPISRRVTVEHGLVAADGLHPSEMMYAEWVRELLPVALDALGRRAPP